MNLQYTLKNKDSSFTEMFSSVKNPETTALLWRTQKSLHSTQEYSTVKNGAESPSKMSYCQKHFCSYKMF